VVRIAAYVSLTMGSVQRAEAPARLVVVDAIDETAGRFYAATGSPRPSTNRFASTDG
jgi:hypothetical protein